MLPAYSSTRGQHTGSLSLNDVQAKSNLLPSNGLEEEEEDEDEGLLSATVKRVDKNAISSVCVFN